MDVSPIVLDREIARAAQALAKARRARGPDAELDDPLAEHRRVSTRTLYDELESPSGPSAPAEPLRAALRAWVAVLTLERVLSPDSARVAAAWRAETIELDKPEVARTSP